MARVSLSRTVVWVCVAGWIFTSGHGDGGLWRVALSHPLEAPDVCPSSRAHDRRTLALCPSRQRWQHQQRLEHHWCGHQRRLYWLWCRHRWGWYHHLSEWGRSHHPSAGTHSGNEEKKHVRYSISKLYTHQNKGEGVALMLYNHWMKQIFYHYNKSLKWNLWAAWFIIITFCQAVMQDENWTNNSVKNSSSMNQRLTSKACGLVRKRARGPQQGGSVAVSGGPLWVRMGFR